MSRQRSRRGNAAYTVVTIMALVGFGALVLDIGRTQVVHAQLQNAADAAAHAAVAELDGTAAGLARARAAAVHVAGLNRADNRAVVLDPNDGNAPDGDIVLGVYEDGAFTPSTDPEDVNAVRALGAQPNVAPILSGLAFGTTELAAAATSTSVAGEYGGAGATDCFLPFALPMCIFEGRTDEALNLTDLKLQPATGDNVGWGSPWGTPSASVISDQLNGQCSSGSVEIGDRLWLGNGALTSALTEVATKLASSGTSWDADAWGARPARMTGSAIPAGSYGRTLEGPILLFDGGPEYCDADAASGNWNPSTPSTVAGFAWGSVYDVKVSGSASSRNIKMRLELLDDYTFGTKGGGPDHGVTFEEPRRVVP